MPIKQNYCITKNWIKERYVSCYHPVSSIELHTHLWFQFLLSYDNGFVWCAVPCRAVECRPMACNGIAWRGRSCHGLTNHAVIWFCRGIAWLHMTWRGLPFCGVPYHGVQWHAMSWRGMVASCNVISCRGKSCCGLVYRDVALCCAMACHAVEVATAASHLLVCLCLVVAGAASGA
jgi:hypothetical protein